MSGKKLFLFLFLWNITLNANVQNEDFSETQGRYFTPSKWIGSGVSFWKDGSDGDGKSIENGNKFMILMNGTTYQDVYVGTGYSQCSVNYREAHHPDATGKITVEYGGKSQSHDFTNVFHYDSNGEGVLSDSKTLTGPKVCSSFSTVRIRLDGTGNDTVGYGKVDDISLTCQKDVVLPDLVPATLTCPSDYTKISLSSQKMYVGGTTLLDITSKFTNIDKPINIIFGDILTSDGYSDRVNTKGQYHESVKVVFTDSKGNDIAQTGYSDDLKDGVEYASAFTNLGTVTLPTGAKGVKLVHYGDGQYGTGDKSSPNSVDFKGLCYKAVDIIVPKPTIGTGQCYAMTDNESKVYELTMSPNGNPLPTPRTISIDRQFNGEGSAYRASNNTLYAFQAVGDTQGPSDLYAINLTTGKTSKVVSGLFSGAVDGAEFYHNPITDKEILYVISGETNSKLYAFYADSWSAVDGYPKNVSGDNANLSSLAIDPSTGNAYAIDDYNYDSKKPKIYKLDLLTGKTTFIVATKELVDAEGLAYAVDGNLYLEDEREYKNGRKIYKVDLKTGDLIPSANFDQTIGDWESIACDGTQMIIDYPMISIEDINDQTHVEGNSGTKEFVFTVSLSEPAVEDVTFTYVLEGQTATKGEDFIDKTGTLTIPKGSSETTISVEINGDVTIEPDETFIVKLQDVTNAVVKKGEGLGTIINDDAYAKIGDRVWLDSNHNGIQDEANLVGVPNVTVKLYDANNQLLTTTTTNNDGYYEFGELVANDYMVHFTVPNNYMVTLTTQGNDRCLDSDVNTAGQSSKTTLISGQDNLCVDMGIYPTPKPKIEIETSTNGIDADTATGPEIAFGGDVTWSYVVKNSGNVPLINVQITDDKLGAICSVATLEVNATKTCEKSDKALSGQYENIGTATAQYASQTVEDTDPSHYLGGLAPIVKVDIETATNGVDADTGTGPSIIYGADVVWSYVVKNIGNVVLTNIVVTDSKLGNVCTLDTLAVGGTKTCTKTGMAITGQYENIGKVTAKYEALQVEDVDPTHYMGEKRITKAPLAVDDYANGETGKPVTLNSIVNDTDEENDLDPTTVVLIHENVIEDGKKLVVVGEGVWTVTPNGAITFTPESGFTNDPTPIKYTVSDEAGNVSNEATESIDYPQTVPTANDDNVTGELSKVTTIDILVNDVDPENDLNQSRVNFIVPDGATGSDEDNDGDIETVVIPGEGIWLVDANGTVTFTPEEAFSENPTPINYTVKDYTDKVSNEATISIVYPDSSKATLGDKVWYDLNKDGKQDGTEPGLAGIVVSLYDGNEEKIATTSTDDNGNYAFANLMAGEYRVEFTVKEGWRITIQNVENNTLEALDSDAEVISGKTDVIILKNGEVNKDIDVGMYQIARATIDIDKVTNGKDGLNIMVGEAITWNYIVKNKGNVRLTDIAVVDDKEGEVACPQDSLEVQEEMTCTKEGVAILGAYENKGTVIAKTPEDKNITDSDGSSYTGTSKPIENATIGDRIWLDSNRNGIQDSDETIGMSNVTVKLFKSDNTEVSTTTSTEDGSYLFTDVVPNDYYVKFSIPTGYSITKNKQGNDDMMDSDPNQNGKTGSFTINSGESLTNIDMGLHQTLVSFGNKVWYDGNEDGIIDTDEKGIGGVLAKLFTADGNLVAEKRTNSDGGYLFTDLVPGKYYVQFIVPKNYIVSPQNKGNNESKDSDADSSGKTDIVTLRAGIDNRTTDMGLYQSPAKLGDRVWYDANKNGIQDGGESGIKEIVVKLYDVTNQLVLETKTDSSGLYVFDNVIPAEYYIQFVAPAGYTITNQNQGGDDAKDSDTDSSGKTDFFTLSAGDQESGMDMGMYQQVVSLGDRVWLDTNKNGIQDVGENGIKDINVSLYNGNDLVQSMLTDENGNYLFSRLAPGDYRIELKDVLDEYKMSPKEQGNDENNDSNVNEKGETDTFTLTPGSNDLSWDMGMYKDVCPASKSAVGDVVWFDIDANGVQDIGESGIENIEVKLYDADDVLIATQKTDKHGLYQFNNLVPSEYYVVFTVPSEYKVSPKTNANDDRLDSDANEDGRTEIITLIAGEITSTVDMGLYKEGGTIGDKVWDDANGNGLQDESELGVYNVEVTLYNDKGNMIETTKTNASGLYHFTNVPKGRYSLTFKSLPTDFIFTHQNQGGDETKDSDVDATGKSELIIINGGDNITYVDAGIRKFDIPGASNDSIKGLTGKSSTIDVLANDTEGTYNFDATTVKITSAPEGATLSEDGKVLTVNGEGIWSVDASTGMITFAPQDGFVGDPTPITYSVQDTHGNETGAEVTVDYPPVANDDLVNGEVGKQIIIHVLDNDTNTSSPLDPSSVRIIDPETDNEVENVIIAGEGSWSVNSSGSITFTPEDGFKNRPTPIFYIVREENGDSSNRATITIAYPDAVDDVYIIPAGEKGEIVINVSENDSNNTIPSTILLGCTDTGVKRLVIKDQGVWQVQENGVIGFTPEDGFVGDPTDIKYTVALVSGGRSNCANVDIRHALLANDDHSTLNVGNPTRIKVLANDSGDLDVTTVRLIVSTTLPNGTTLSSDGRTLTVPTQGVWHVDDAGVVVFTLETGSTTAPTPIGYTVENSNGDVSNEAMITITQGAMLLVANDDIGKANEGNPVIIEILNNDVGDLNKSSARFVDAQGNLVSTITVAGEGVWSINESGVAIFTPEAGYTGTPTPIHYRVRDNSGEISNVAGISITGICVCEPYETSIPSMGKIGAMVMMLLTLLFGILLVRQEEKYKFN